MFPFLKGIKIISFCRWDSHLRIVGYEMRWRTGASHLSIQGTITAPAQSLEERLTSLVYYLTSRPSRTTVWSRWEKGCRYTHSTRCLVKNEPCTYQKKFDWLRLHASLQNVFDRFTLTPAIQIDSAIKFSPLKWSTHFFLSSMVQFFFYLNIKVQFFFSSKIRVQFFFLKKPGPPPPGYEMGGPYPSCIPPPQECIRPILLEIFQCYHWIPHSHKHGFRHQNLVSIYLRNWVRGEDVITLILMAAILKMASHRLYIPIWWWWHPLFMFRQVPGTK